MDYRMYKPTSPIPANTNVVTLIKQELKSFGITSRTPLRFIAFEADAGTTFTLNDANNKMEVPSTGNFITPFDGERGVQIYNLTFDSAFEGNIYYIP